jgi:hypothetical protein
MFDGIEVAALVACWASEYVSDFGKLPTNLYVSTAISKPFCQILSSLNFSYWLV